jgi:hypothetical protein
MDIEIRSLINKGYLTSQEENKLLTYLKSLPEEKAYEALKYMVEQKNPISLIFAKKILRQKDYVRQMFESGLSSADASSIKLWLDFAIPKLGLRAVEKSIRKIDNGSNKIAQKAAYWLPMLSSKTMV